MDVSIRYAFDQVGVEAVEEVVGNVVVVERMVSERSHSRHRVESDLARFVLTTATLDVAAVHRPARHVHVRVHSDEPADVLV